MKQSNYDLFGMPTLPVRRGINTAFWAYGGGHKAHKAKVVPTKSAFDALQNTTASNPFGSSTTSWLDEAHKQLNNISTLTPAYEQLRQQATKALQDNLAYLQQTPDQRFATLQGGGDPLYNILKENTQNNYDQALLGGRLGASRNGLSNSTALGGYLGQLQSQNEIQKNTDILNALNYNNQTAATNYGLSGQTVSELAGLLGDLSSLSNTDFMTGMQQADAAAAATAQAQNAANLQYAQAQNALAAQSPLSGLLGAGLSLGGTLLGSAFGGPAGGAIGGGLGGAFSRLFTGSGPSSSFGSFSNSPLLNSLGFNNQAVFHPGFTNLSQGFY